MKVLAVLLLCAFVAVQGRSAGEKSSKALAALGENPAVVHLRIAVSTSGLLNSAVGTLISDRWVLTCGEVVSTARFIWIRYGAVSVINPSLVTETSTVSISTDSNVALISVNRAIKSTDNIKPIGVIGGSTSETATFCGFGGSDDVPGESLACSVLELTEADGSITASSDDITEFDLGAGLVSDDSVIGVLVDSSGTFAIVSDYVDWIASETGLDLSSRSAQPDDSLRVHFVN